MTCTYKETFFWSVFRFVDMKVSIGIRNELFIKSCLNIHTEAISFFQYSKCMTKVTFSFNAASKRYISVVCS